VAVPLNAVRFAVRLLRPPLITAVTAALAADQETAGAEARQTGGVEHQIPVAAQITSILIRADDRDLLRRDIHQSAATAIRGLRAQLLGGSIGISGESATVVTVARMAEFVARGAARIETDGRGQRHGAVLGGGSVTFDTGSIILESGSLIDVSGASGEIDVSSGGGRSVPATLASNGGSISVKGQGLIEGICGAARPAAGSIPVGKSLAEMAGRCMKPAIMELGGHAPVIVCDDVDPAATAATSVTGKSRNAGQVCVAPTRFFVQESIYQRFADTFAENAAQLKVGNGLDPSTQLGPLANARRIDAMEDFVADARSKGAKVLAGGQRIGNSGYFFPLTVLADVPDDARVMRDEPFGPLALVNPVRDLDEAIEKANSLPYGLAAYAFTRSAQNADRLASEVEVGNLSINHFVASVAETPFGGVKESGYGREGGTEGLQCYTVTKNVSHKMI
jgi:hypothetical protein